MLKNEADVSRVAGADGPVKTEKASEKKETDAVARTAATKKKRDLFIWCVF